MFFNFLNAHPKPSPKKIVERCAVLFLYVFDDDDDGRSLFMKAKRPTHDPAGWSEERLAFTIGSSKTGIRAESGRILLCSFAIKPPASQPPPSSALGFGEKQSEEKSSLKIQVLLPA